MRGNSEAISFRNVKVSTNDNKLQIAATGDITNLRDKYKLIVKFDVSRMHAKPGVAEQIINQFATKKLMMKQLNNLGDINYTGSFSVIYKKEIFGGLLKTGAGNLSFNFTLDNVKKDIVGKVSTKNLQLGKVINMKKLGPIEASADFNIDISKQRKTEMRKETGGKLPIGSFNAKVDDAAYMGVHIRNLTATFNSDGAIASGEVYKTGRIRDLYFSYSFTSTDEMHKMKISKPGIKFHKETEEYKAQKAERKKQKEQKKLEKQQQKDNTQEGEKKGLFKKLFSKKKKTETT